MSLTLDQAQRKVWQDNWKHRRSGDVLLSQLNQALTTLETQGIRADRATPDDVVSKDVSDAIAAWYRQGLSPATINKRLSCLSMIGVKVEGLKQKNKPQFKWYLDEKSRKELLLNQSVSDGMKRLIVVVTRTGMRIEEALRLRWEDLTGNNYKAITVRGEKTYASQATLPISTHLGEWFKLWFELVKPEATSSDLLFNETYPQLVADWTYCRLKLGVTDVPTATLKALRRSAARYLHVDCGMPLDMVRQYLRHESIKTTMEYLRLTGGYREEEMRRYLR